MNTNHLTDKDLVTRILAGHPDLFGSLVERHIRAAHAIAYARLGNTADAEDAVQEAFLRAYEKLGTLRDPARFAAWLLTIARHEAARIAAKRNRPLRAEIHTATSHSPLITPDFEAYSSHQPESSDPSIESIPSIHPDPAQHELNAILRDHVMRLPEPAREVLLLHYFAGYSAREIADLLDLRRPAVLKRLQRAREALAETMLRDLEVARPSPNSFAKQAARIVGLAGAMGIPSLATTSSTAAAAAAISLKVWVGAAAAIVLATGAALFVRANAGIQLEPPDDPPAGTIVRHEATAPSQPVAEPAVAQATSQEPANSSATSSGSAQETEAIKALAVDASVNQDLNGTWHVQVLESAPQRLLLRSIELDLSQSASNITIKTPNDNKSLLGRGSIFGKQVHLDFTLPELSAMGRPSLTLEGEFTTGADKIQMKGTYIDGEHPYTQNTDEGPRTQTPSSIAVEAILTRLPREELSRRKFTAQKEREAQALYTAIKSYRKDHAGAYPPRLEELVPAYLASLDPYSQTAGASLEYTRPTHPQPDFSQFPYGLNEVVRDDTLYHPELSVPDRLLALEADLARIWGDGFLIPPLVVLRYNQFDLRVYVTTEGNISNTSGGTTDPRTEQAQLRAECANNLKQLGLSVQMFTSDMPGKYSPPGWLSIYPEYLPDRRILTCPSAEPAHLSYKLVWPTANAEEMKQLYRDRVNPSASDTAASAGVPIVIETHECSGSGGRNILFLDGHVTYVKGPLEVNPAIAPFLNLR